MIELHCKKAEGRCRTFRGGCQARYRAIYSGVEDSITEDQQERSNLATQASSQEIALFFSARHRIVLSIYK